MRPPALRFAVAFALLVSGVLILAAPALALPDRIAYRCDLDICLVDPAVPAVVQNLTANGATSLDSDPIWSPDGTRVAFLSSFGGLAFPGRNVFVMDPDAPGQTVNVATQLTFFPSGNATIGYPVYSPDGTRVAFERTIGGKVGIYVVRADGTTVTPTTVTTDGVHPTWSADSARIAFSKGEQVFIAAADGSGVPAPLPNGAGHSPVWSPDGSRIAFDVIDPVEKAPFVDLRVVPADGTGTPVTTLSNYTQWTFAAWSPDGTKIAYRSTVNNDGRIRVVNADGTGDHALAFRTQENVYQPTWSPDGSRVAFESFSRPDPLDPNSSLNTIYAASATDPGAPSPRVTSTDKDYTPAWRPDPAYRPISAPAPGPGAAGPAPATPSGTGPPGKPKLVWFTSRIPFTGPPNLFVAKVGCSAPVCSIGATATVKGRTGGAAAAAKARRKPVVVGTGRLTLRANQTRSLKLKLNRVGIRLLLKRRSLPIRVTVTTTSPGRAKTTESRDFRVVVKPRKRR